ncbi:glycosyltransferase family 4 protein [Chromobacterium sp. IIBBL 290-4]|uniref:glycosyltransferase family 4 protein n=1 Tax=Chromobacterium sp. IIBBL 290-4 TaxID=2953890 RepID=UPI0020B7F116|nr:glycosyltransferase family 4 protein [Chromobacterium sp. IIBBL 290-4]UTH75285.1 glycosyltransferase family 4 protein [Chromobacterium sp. IIBBL 290-4]
MSTPRGINLVFHSIRPGGGMERYVMDVIAELCRRGIAVRGIARKIDWPEPPRGVELSRLADRTPFSRLNNLLFERKALRACHPDWKTIGISRVTGPVDLAIVGGTHIGHLLDKGKLRPGFYDKRTIAHETLFYANAKAIMPHSVRVGEQIRQHYGMAGDKLSVLYPPVDTGKFSLSAREGRAALRRELGIAPDQFMLLFPSNNHALKGGDLILQVLAGRKDVTLVAAGKAPLSGERVVNAGFRSDMPALYAAADATILASKYEAFGMVGPESILCGTPVLFADTVGAVEVLSEPGCYVFQRDAVSLRKALERLMEKRVCEGIELSKLAQQSIHYPYSLAGHVDSLLDMLES